MKNKGYNIIVYADDICIVCKKENTDRAILDAKEEILKIGLTLNESKTQILSRDRKVEFLQ